MFQNEWGKDALERFWHLTHAAPPDAQARLERLAADLSSARRDPAPLSATQRGTGR